METQKTISLPIDKISYSDLTQLLRNPIIFKLKKILKIYNPKKGVSGMVGIACHEALKFYYGGNPDIPVPIDNDEARAMAFDIGMKKLEDTPDMFIKYGKTGTREKMLTTYTKAMSFYFAEEPEYKKILVCEEKLEAEIKTYDGDSLPLPCVAIPDLVVQEMNDEEDIIDTKFVKAFTKYEDEDGEPFEDYIKVVQAEFLDHLVFTTKNIRAKRVIFREVKTTENAICKEESCTEEHNEGGRHPQIQDYIIPLDHEPYRIIFYNLFNDVIKFLSNPDVIYLPNLSDPFDGQEAGLIYAQGLISADMSDIEVMHKVKDVMFTSKRFITSRIDQVQNANLLPEEKIKLKLAEFGIPVQPQETKVGASVTQYRFKVSSGIPMSRFAKHKNDIARAIEAKGEIRILAPIPGTSLVGIEVANEVRTAIMLSKKYLMPKTLNIPIGVDVNGTALNLLLNDMPHLLIAGSTNSGKSVLIHIILNALTKQMTHHELDLTLIDPKRVELKKFEKIKHLNGKKIIYEHEDAVRALLDLVDEMECRYKELEHAKVRNIAEYNTSEPAHPMSYKVVVIDEMADFMLKGKIEDKKKNVNYNSKSKRWLHGALEDRADSGGYLYLKPDNGERVKLNEDGLKKVKVPLLAQADKDTLIDLLEAHDAMNILNRPDANTEYLIVRLAQLGRAAGIHLVIATQSPRADVITGLIKANFPTKIALMTSSVTESMIILGEMGAEKLSGKGDMILMYPGGKERLQGFMID